MSELLKRIKSEKGQAMVEFALVLPFLILILCGIIDFGWLFFNQLSLNNAARETARYAVVNTTDANIETLLKEKANDISGDLFDDNIVVKVTFTESDKLDGDIVVELSADMNIMTPVLGAINGSQTKTLVSTVTMKAES